MITAVTMTDDQLLALAKYLDIMQVPTSVRVFSSGPDSEAEHLGMAVYAVIAAAEGVQLEQQAQRWKLAKKVEAEQTEVDSALLRGQLAPHTHLVPGGYEVPADPMDGLNCEGCE